MAKAAMLMLVAGCAAPTEDETQIDRQNSSSNIRHESYKKLAQSLADLAKANPNWVEVIDYGESKNHLALRVVKIANGRAPSTEGHPAVLITGATHGDEYLGIEAELPEWLLRHRDLTGVKRFFDAGGVIYLIPVVNPDGFDSKKRANASGEDLNRDFVIGSKTPRQPEVRQLTSWLREELADSRAALKLTLDYHCCLGSMIYPGGLSEADLEAHRAMANMVTDYVSSDYTIGTAEETLGFGYRDDNTSMAYYHSTYGSISLSMEGKASTWFGFVAGEKMDSHGAMWNAILAQIAAKTKAPARR